MKNVKTGLYLVGMVLMGLGVAMAVTNPNPRAYDDFATEQLTAYLRDNTCADANPILRDPCNSLLVNNQATIENFISESTQRQNYGFFSIYKTNLTLDPLVPPFLRDSLPAYHFETVGLFGTFKTYRAEKKQ